MTATTSPLAEMEGALAEASAATRGAVAISPTGPLAQMDVRADGRDGAIAAQLRRRLGVALPTTPNTWVGARRAELLWLGLDEWLAVAPASAAPGLEAALVSALAEGREPGAVVDVSDQRAGIEVRGPGARAVLATGCALDLHPRAFAPGRCAQTLVARIGAIVVARPAPDAHPAYRLLVRSSFAVALAEWLVDATAELRPEG